MVDLCSDAIGQSQYSHSEIDYHRNDQAIVRSHAFQGAGFAGS
ncbi:hypothetical protein NIES2104_24210 [Leptolyngbya sp. NIES-2104]|nr:hypothetical protein NIES2104_24210 [Leptolyngbya sp. NIES-2104]